MRSQRGTGYYLRHLFIDSLEGKGAVRHSSVKKEAVVGGCTWEARVVPMALTS